MCQTDYSGYPDCRRDFIDSMESSLSLALGSGTRIHTPLMDLTKAQIIQRGWHDTKRLCGFRDELANTG